MTETPETDTPHDPETAAESTTAPAETEPGGSPDTFPRAYVERLRRENASYRTRAGRADELAERLLAATIREATAGILADPADLPADGLLDDDGYPDPEKIADAARELVARKPHLGDRRPRGDVGQGARPAGEPVNLAAMLRDRAS